MVQTGTGFPNPYGFGGPQYGGYGFGGPQPFGGPGFFQPGMSPMMQQILAQCAVVAPQYPWFVPPQYLYGGFPTCGIQQPQSTSRRSSQYDGLTADEAAAVRGERPGARSSKSKKKGRGSRSRSRRPSREPPESHASLRSRILDWGAQSTASRSDGALSADFEALPSSSPAEHRGDLAAASEVIARGDVRPETLAHLVAAAQNVVDALGDPSAHGYDDRLREALGDSLRLLRLERGHDGAITVEACDDLSLFVTAGADYAAALNAVHDEEAPPAERLAALRGLPGAYVGAKLATEAASTAIARTPLAPPRLPRELVVVNHAARLSPVGAELQAALADEAADLSRARYPEGLDAAHQELTAYVETLRDNAENGILDRQAIRETAELYAQLLGAHATEHNRDGSPHWDLAEAAYVRFAAEARGLGLFDVQFGHPVRVTVTAAGAELLAARERYEQAEAALGASGQSFVGQARQTLELPRLWNDVARCSAQLHPPLIPADFAPDGLVQTPRGPCLDATTRDRVAGLLQDDLVFRDSRPADLAEARALRASFAAYADDMHRLIQTSVAQPPLTAQAGHQLLAAPDTGGLHPAVESYFDGVEVFLALAPAVRGGAADWQSNADLLAARDALVARRLALTDAGISPRLLVLDADAVVGDLAQRAQQTCDDLQRHAEATATAQAQQAALLRYRNDLQPLRGVLHDAWVQVEARLADGRLSRDDLQRVGDAAATLDAALDQTINDSRRLGCADVGRAANQERAQFRQAYRLSDDLRIDPTLITFVDERTALAQCRADVETQRAPLAKAHALLAVPVAASRVAQARLALQRQGVAVGLSDEDRAGLVFGADHLATLDPAGERQLFACVQTRQDQILGLPARAGGVRPSLVALDASRQVLATHRQQCLAAGGPEPQLPEPFVVDAADVILAPAAFDYAQGLPDYFAVRDEFVARRQAGTLDTDLCQRFDAAYRRQDALTDAVSAGIRTRTFFQQPSAADGQLVLEARARWAQASQTQTRPRTRTREGNGPAAALEARRQELNERRARLRQDLDAAATRLSGGQLRDLAEITVPGDMLLAQAWRKQAKTADLQADLQRCADSVLPPAMRPCFLLEAAVEDGRPVLNPRPELLRHFQRRDDVQIALETYRSATASPGEKAASLERLPELQSDGLASAQALVRGGAELSIWQPAPSVLTPPPPGGHQYTLAPEAQADLERLRGLVATAVAQPVVGMRSDSPPLVPPVPTIRTGAETDLAGLWAPRQPPPPQPPPQPTGFANFEDPEVLRALEEGFASAQAVAAPRRRRPARAEHAQAQAQAQAALRKFDEVDLPAFQGGDHSLEAMTAIADGLRQVVVTARPGKISPEVRQRIDAVAPLLQIQGLDPDGTVQQDFQMVLSPGALAFVQARADFAQACDEAATGGNQRLPALIALAPRAAAVRNTARAMVADTAWAERPVFADYPAADAFLTPTPEGGSRLSPAGIGATRDALWQMHSPDLRAAIGGAGSADAFVAALEALDGLQDLLETGRAQGRERADRLEDWPATYGNYVAAEALLYEQLGLPHEDRQLPVGLVWTGPNRFQLEESLEEEVETLRNAADRLERAASLQDLATATAALATATPRQIFGNAREVAQCFAQAPADARGPLPAYLVEVALEGGVEIDVRPGVQAYARALAAFRAEEGHARAATTADEFFAALEGLRAAKAELEMTAGELHAVDLTVPPFQEGPSLVEAGGVLSADGSARCRDIVATATATASSDTELIRLEEGVRAAIAVEAVHAPPRPRGRVLLESYLARILEKRILGTPALESAMLAPELQDTLDRIATFQPNGEKAPDRRRRARQGALRCVSCAYEAAKLAGAPQDEILVRSQTLLEASFEWLRNAAAMFETTARAEWDVSEISSARRAVRAAIAERKRALEAVPPDHMLRLFALAEVNRNAAIDIKLTDIVRTAEGKPEPREAKLRKGPVAERKAAATALATLVGAGAAEPLWFFDTQDPLDYGDAAIAAAKRAAALKRVQIRHAQAALTAAGIDFAPDLRAAQLQAAADLAALDRDIAGEDEEAIETLPKPKRSALAQWGAARRRYEAQQAAYESQPRIVQERQAQERDRAFEAAIVRTTPDALRGRGAGRAAERERRADALRVHRAVATQQPAPWPRVQGRMREILRVFQERQQEAARAEEEQEAQLQADLAALE